MTETFIDVWNVKTSDAALLSELHSEAELVRNYQVTNRQNFLAREASDRRQTYPTNIHAYLFQQFVECVIMPAIQNRVIRAWHYTRLTDAEVELLRTCGIFVSTLEMIRRRLDALISVGFFTAETAEALYAASPFHHQNDSRSNKFWMTSHSRSIDDSGVALLLESWGGEGVYFWLREVKLIEFVKSIGRPRVVEMLVPLSATFYAYSAAEAVVATFARSLGCTSESAEFDLYSTQNLGPSVVARIHSEGEVDYSLLARGYPANFPRTYGT